MRPCAYDTCKIGTKNIELGELYNRQVERLFLQGGIIASLDGQLEQILTALGVDDTPVALSEIARLQAGWRAATENEGRVWRDFILHDEFILSIWNDEMGGGEFSADDAANLVDWLADKMDWGEVKRLAQDIHAAPEQEAEQSPMELSEALETLAKIRDNIESIDGEYSARETMRRMPIINDPAIHAALEELDGDELARYAQ